MSKQLQVERRGESIPLSRNIGAGRVGSCLDFAEFFAVVYVRERCLEWLGSSGVKRCEIWSFHAPLPRGKDAPGAQGRRWRFQGKRMDFSGNFSCSSQAFLGGRKAESSGLKGMICGAGSKKNQVVWRGLRAELQLRERGWDVGMRMGGRAGG